MLPRGMPAEAVVRGLFDLFPPDDLTRSAVPVASGSGLAVWRIFQSCLYISERRLSPRIFFTRAHLGDFLNESRPFRIDHLRWFYPYLRCFAAGGRRHKAVPQWRYMSRRMIFLSYAPLLRRLVPPEAHS
ncbi:MAG: hypothetical protein Greene071436_220 [Parcubacteria group bacterium Greene0714_36]|nr:MAG: hypothetical protein Greene071436_220 [Parcubacteria group bacterium Greene0714_36]